MSELSGLQKRLWGSVPMLTSEERRPEKQRSEAPQKLEEHRKQGHLFAVRVGNDYFYPRFQFSSDARPLPVIADLLSIVPEDARGWALLSWLEAPSTLLSGSKPSDVLTENPSEAIRAAAEFYDPE